MPPSSTAPLISVYIATRNRKALLSRAMQSVLSQTYPCVELIVVDDASTDGTPEMLKHWCTQDARVRYAVLPQPGGAPVARNKAIEMAAGAFVTGLDDDDIFLPDRLERFWCHWSGLAPVDDRVFLYTQVHSVGPSGAVVTKMPAETTIDALCRSNCVGNQVFAPRSIFLSAGGFTEGLPAWQDLDLWLSMLRLGCRGCLVDAVTMELDATPRGDRISDQARARIESARDAVLAHHGDWLNATQKRDLYLQSLSRHYGFSVRGRDARALLAIDPSWTTIRRVLSLSWRRLRGR